MDAVLAEPHKGPRAEHPGQGRSNGERKIFIVLGNPNAELKGMLDGFNAMYLKPLGEFEYWA
jgi:hypothetical protein